MDAHQDSTVIQLSTTTRAPCAICNCRLVNTVVQLDNCEHEFHQHCFGTWFRMWWNQGRSICPVCNQAFDFILHEQLVAAELATTIRAPCSICHCRLVNTVVQLDVCEHEFHQGCFDTWFNMWWNRGHSNCPACKKAFDLILEDHV
jgi:hypothetical protein